MSMMQKIRTAHKTMFYVQSLLAFVSNVSIKSTKSRKRNGVKKSMYVTTLQERIDISHRNS
jgi:hypothetical protein